MILIRKIREHLYCDGKSHFWSVPTRFGELLFKNTKFSGLFLKCSRFYSRWKKVRRSVSSFVCVCVWGEWRFIYCKICERSTLHSRHPPFVIYYLWKYSPKIFTGVMFVTFRCRVTLCFWTSVFFSRKDQRKFLCLTTLLDI